MGAKRLSESGPEAIAGWPSARFGADREVTALALTPDGAYVAAGFVNGTLRLYPVLLAHSGATTEGFDLGRIEAKGMYTSTLKVHVAVSDDRRFVFAGVLRGTTEMLAADLSALPTWNPNPPKEDSDVNHLRKRVAVHRFSDAKLRGFGAVARVQKLGCDTATEYRLFCGVGIKNIHIWSFIMQENGKPSWNCIFDVQTNGMSVEFVSFRSNGLEGISKSDNQCLRVWDLSGAAGSRPPYRDVQNTQDAKGIFGDFAYGGMYNLSMVNMDAAEWANRTEIALPADPAASGGGRRRHCRTVKEVMGTQDGRHLLVMCSDGQVLYYHRSKISGLSLKALDISTIGDAPIEFMKLAMAGPSRVPTFIISRSCGLVDVKPLPCDKEDGCEYTPPPTPPPLHIMSPASAMKSMPRLDLSSRDAKAADSLTHLSLPPPMTPRLPAIATPDTGRKKRSVVPASVDSMLTDRGTLSEAESESSISSSKKKAKRGTARDVAVEIFYDSGTESIATTTAAHSDVESDAGSILETPKKESHPVAISRSGKKLGRPPGPRPISRLLSVRSTSRREEKTAKSPPPMAPPSPPSPLPSLRVIKIQERNDLLPPPTLPPKVLAGLAARSEQLPPIGCVTLSSGCRRVAGLPMKISSKLCHSTACELGQVRCSLKAPLPSTNEAERLREELASRFRSEHTLLKRAYLQGRDRSKMREIAIAVSAGTDAEATNDPNRTIRHAGAFLWDQRERTGKSTAGGTGVPLEDWIREETENFWSMCSEVLGRQRLEAKALRDMQTATLPAGKVAPLVSVPFSLEGMVVKELGD